MSEPDDIPNRVTRLEREMREVRVLAVGADEDISQVQAALRAHTGLLHALRQTQVEQGREIKGLRQAQVEQGQEIKGLRQTQVEQGQEIKGLRQAQVEQGQEIGHLRDHVDQRLDGVDQRLGRVEDRLELINAGVVELLNHRRGSQGKG